MFEAEFCMVTGDTDARPLYVFFLTYSRTLFRLSHTEKFWFMFEKARKIRNGVACTAEDVKELLVEYV